MGAGLIGLRPMPRAAHTLVEPVEIPLWGSLAWSLEAQAIRAWARGADRVAAHAPPATRPRKILDARVPLRWVASGVHCLGLIGLRPMPLRSVRSQARFNVIYYTGEYGGWESKRSS